MNKHHSTTSILQTYATPEAAYKALVGQAKLQDDAAQQKVLSHLQALHEKLTPKNKLLKLFSAKDKPRSMYIWGAVGRGKSLLMDIFYESLPFRQKRREHFHAFMQQVHHRIHTLRQKGREDENSSSIVVDLAEDMAKTLRVLCLDEFQVTDITDAMLLAKLFTTLVNEGVIVIATSNRPPESLYLGGLQRERFLPFIDLVLEEFDVLELSSPCDYRLKQLKGIDQVYYSPLGKEADAFIKNVTSAFSHGMAHEKRKIEIQGRSLAVEVLAGNVACFSFHALCEKPLGPADYLEIARLFHTVIITNIPQMSAEKRNEAKRFVTLIDALYEHKVKLICTAATPPDDLYVDRESYFEFNRTISRLHEMQSEQYFNASHLA